jgi:hypothetical protein
MACSTLKSNILLSDGTTKPIHQLRVGDEVDTLDQHTFKRGNHKVIFIEKSNSKLVALHFDKEDIECSPNHRFYSKNKAKWIKAKDLTEGDKVISLNGTLEFISRKRINEGEIIDLTVEGAHTYISGNILSHNKGNTTVVNEPPPPDKTFENYLKYQRERDEDAQYRTWAGDLQAYKTAKGKQQTGRSGWQAKYDTTKDQLGRGLISYTEAQNQLKDYATDYNLAAGSVAFAGGSDPRSAWDRYQIIDDPDTEEVESGVRTPEGGWTQLPTYETPANWQNWSVDQDLNQLSDYYLGTSTTDADGNVTRSGGLLGERQTQNIGTAYQQILGRIATDDELADAKANLESGYFGGLDDFKTSLTSSTEYKNKFGRSYMENYYDTMFGKEQKNEAGEWTGKRTFNFDKSLLPTYRGGTGGTGSQLETDTGVALPDWQDSYTGTPAELDFTLDNVRESRKFLYSAGLTNLQGTIDKEIQSLKNEGGKEISRINAAGNLYAGLVGSFSF